MMVRTRTTVELDRDTVQEVFMKVLEGYAAKAFFRDVMEKGKTVRRLYEDDPDWRHGSVSEYPVKDPTDVQKAAVLLLAALGEAELARKELERKRKP